MDLVSGQDEHPVNCPDGAVFSSILQVKTAHYSSCFYSLIHCHQKAIPRYQMVNKADIAGFSMEPTKRSHLVAGIFLKSTAASFNWSRADVAALRILSLVGVAIGAPLIGYIADRMGW